VRTQRRLKQGNLSVIAHRISSLAGSVSKVALRMRPKKSDLKLPVTIVPRHTLTGDFYFVLSGPYGPQKIPDVMLQLQGAGFAEVHPVKTTLARENSNP
jgi:hypothetical protein